MCLGIIEYDYFPNIVNNLSLNHFHKLPYVFEPDPVDPTRVAI